MLNGLIADTQRLLEVRLATAQRPVLWTSGGKDSTVLLHLCRPWRQKLRVLHASKTGDDGWPGVTECLMQHAEAWGYETIEQVRPWLTFSEYVQEFGWPVEVVPTRLEGNTAVASSPYRTQPLKLASWLHCTYVRTLYPLIQATIACDADLILTGSRLSDAPANAAFAQDVSIPGLACKARCNPLAAWSTDDIWQYLDTHNVTLPPLYAWKRGVAFEAVDCLSCTWQPEHWDILREQHPDEYAKRWPQAQAVYQAVQDEMQDYGARVARLPLSTESE